EVVLDVRPETAPLVGLEEPLALQLAAFVVDEERLSLGLEHSGWRVSLRDQDRPRHQREASERDEPERHQPPDREGPAPEECKADEEQDPEREGRARRVVDVEAEAGDYSAGEGRQLVVVPQPPEQE